HVEGQCVTGDTKLKVKSEKLKVEYEEIEIKDIKGGEYVLSLNEKTGKIEPAKIKGLLDMEVQPIYEIETEDDKKIRTTGNHPYLVKQNSSSAVNFISMVNSSDIEGISLAEKLYSLFPHTESMSSWGQVNKRFSKDQWVWNGKKIFDSLANLGSQFGREFFEVILGLLGKDELISHNYKGYTLPEAISLRADSYSRFISSRYSFANGQWASISSMSLPTELKLYSLSGNISNNFSSIRQSNSQKAYRSNRNQAGLPFLSEPTTALNSFGKEAPLGANLEKCSIFGFSATNDLVLEDVFAIQNNNSKDENKLLRVVNQFSIKN
ncbi:hypothetical protein KJ636_01560, partial [Patescibacteria group bacterium]|nr:hypothetical protein [Patescibacteria group bacterium]